MGRETRKKGGRRLHYALTAARVKTVREPGRYFDGGGLILLVEASGAKRWKQRLQVRGRRVELGLGSFPAVGLAEAREKAFENRREARAGRNPKTSRLRERGTPTFEEASHKVWELRRGGWRNRRHAKQWLDSLVRYAFPRIGALGIDQIGVEDVLAVLSPIWHERATTARKLRQRMAAVFAWALATGYRADNPADSVRAILPRQRAASTPYRAVLYTEVAEAIASVRASRVALGLRCYFEFQVLCAVRPSEARLAQWNEIDEEAAVWTVPGERMKMGRQHRVPLSDRTLEILAEVRPLGDGRGLVFPGRGARPLPPEAALQAFAAARRRRDPARVSVELPRVGGGAGCCPRGRGGRACAPDRRRDGARVSAFRPVRPAP